MSPAGPTFGQAPAINPLTVDGALQEAQLLDVRFDVVRSTAALLFELRVAYAANEGNTGLLVARQVQKVHWSSAEAGRPGHTAWTVGGSYLIQEESMLHFSFGIFSQATLDLVAKSAEFYFFDIPGFPEAPPNYGDDDSTIRSELATWNSEIAPRSSVRI